MGSTRPQVLMPGVGHRVCRCWTQNNTFCVPCHAGWLLQPSRKAEKLYMKAEMQIWQGRVGPAKKTKSWHFLFNNLFVHRSWNIGRQIFQDDCPSFGDFVRILHLDTWTENIFSCRASTDSDFQCRRPAASSRAPLKSVAGHFWFTNEMTFNKNSLLKLIYWGLVMVSLLSFMHMMRYFIQHVVNTNVHIG